MSERDEAVSKILATMPETGAKPIPLLDPHLAFGQAILTPCSSQIVKVGFNEEVGILEVQFKSGGRYRYANALPTWIALREAFDAKESIGRAFNFDKKTRLLCHPWAQLKDRVWVQRG